MKPVARGFATTSVAKKVEVQEDAVEDPASILDTNEEASASADNASSPGQQSIPKAGLSEEDQILQSHVDKYQNRVEKEVTRAIKVCSLCSAPCRWRELMTALRAKLRQSSRSDVLQKLFRILTWIPRTLIGFSSWLRAERRSFSCFP